MTPEIQKVTISDDYITLGQFLKLTKTVGYGGEEKAFLAMNDVLVNDEREIRRGRKLRHGDIVNISNHLYQICSSKS